MRLRTLCASRMCSARTSERPMWSNLPRAINLAMMRVLCSRETPWMILAGWNKSSLFVPRSLARMKSTFCSIAASLRLQVFTSRRVEASGRRNAQISIRIERHAALRPVR